MDTVQALPADSLYQYCDAEQFTFNSTAELDDLTKIIGQDRALEAIRFGISIQHEGFNLFVLGRNGTGKRTAAQQFLEQKAATESVPDDWCYVYNFDNPHQPCALRLAAGQASGFQEDMEQLVEALKTVLPAAFTSDEYQTQKKAVEEEIQAKQSEALEELRGRAESAGIALIRTPSGFAFAPVRDGEVIGPEDFRRLPNEERERIESEVQELQASLTDIMRQLPHWQRETQRNVKELDEEVARFAVTPLFENLAKKYADHSEILGYLEAVRKDIVNDVSVFMADEQSVAAQLLGSGAATQTRGSSTRRYEVNVIVDHGESTGAPVIFEEQPTYSNLIGRVEHMAHMGALFTDFTLIKPGVLHRASGGYLILDARKLLMQPFAWEGLKQAIRAKEIRIESVGQMASLVSTVSLEPEPIPLDVKVVLLGERLLYYLLYQHDPDFCELFKVAADFEDYMTRSDDNNLAYAQLISTLARKESLRHFDRAAVARVIEHSSRLAGDAERLSTHMQSISDLLREASFWASDKDHELVTKGDVEKALYAQVRRASRARERIQEQVLRETILIDTEGSVIGQINGLAVLSLGNYTFGKPSRITARIRMGKGEVIDIERQVEMGGPIHSKGVLILSSFLGSRYASDRPLTLSASLVFEQSYSGVDGDSASSAELYALLSALADAAIKQCFAVTGSVNQLGQVQAIGGVNEKIEGFFDLCEARGLTGEQGVLIPKANVKHLMLRGDVVKAVTDGAFHIYPIENVDQGIELLTGMAAGKPDEDGEYPENTINRRAVERLTVLAEKQRVLTAGNGDATQGN